MKKAVLFIALFLLSAPLFAEQRTGSNQASATLQINIFVRPTLNTPVPATQHQVQVDEGIIFNLTPRSKLQSTSEEAPISVEGKATTDDKGKKAVLRTTTYTAE